MKALDALRKANNLVIAERIDPDYPLGIHEPKRDGDIGWDLEAMDGAVIPPGATMNVPVNVRLSLPEGVYADIRNRSSMGRRGIYVEANLIDTGYRGPLFVFLRNMNTVGSGWTNPFLLHDKPVATWLEAYQRELDAATVVVEKGERIGQVVFHRATPVWMREDQVLPDTERGEDGFGSTGA